MIRSFGLPLFLTLFTFFLQGCLKGDSGSSSASSGSVSTFAGATAAENNNGDIKIYWNSASDPTVKNYTVFLVGNNNSLTTKGTTGNSTSTSWIVSGLTPWQSYSFIVRANYTDGTIDGNLNLVTAFSYPLPFDFAGVQTADNIDGNSVKVTWDLATGNSTTSAYSISITNYQIMVFDTDGYLPTYDGTADSSKSDYSIGNLASGKDYSFVVRAFGNGMVNTRPVSGLTDGNSIKVSAFTYAGITSANYDSVATAATIQFPAAGNASAINIVCTSTGSPPITRSFSVAHGDDLSTISSVTIPRSDLNASSTYSCAVHAVSAVTNNSDSNTRTENFQTP